MTTAIFRFILHVFLSSKKRKNICGNYPEAHWEWGKCREHRLVYYRLVHYMINITLYCNISLYSNISPYCNISPYSTISLFSNISPYIPRSFFGFCQYTII